MPHIAGRRLLATMSLLVGVSWAPGPAGAQPRPLDQGSDWTPARQAQFYIQDQGSRIMPVSWMAALRRTDGTGFLNGGLERYGYLRNPASPDGLPVGFTTGDWRGVRYVGMTCAACHTRELVVGGATYRVDGGPAITDIQSLFADLDTAAGATLADDTRFAAFAGGVLGAGATAAATASLRGVLQDWHRPYHALMAGALPRAGQEQPWGPGRLDAVGMIFNRLTALDIGHDPDRLIAANVRRADAPTRYPFLWNATQQNYTQWPGFARNDAVEFGLARNVGEVIGVFAKFEPRPYRWWWGTDFRTVNSVNYAGLGAIEGLIASIGPPRWPFAVDPALSARGSKVFDQGGCAGCHAPVGTGDTLHGRPVWKTPLQDTGTDSREHALLCRTAATGVLEGARIPLVGRNLGAEDFAIGILSVSVVTAIIEHHDPLATGRGGIDLLDPVKQAFAAPTGCPATSFPYESRVLQGIWAAAPYLHNGSVPTLADLLEPVDRRPTSFRIGPNYDLARVGIAAAQTRFNQVLVTTGCDQRDSGNSRCGHEFGTSLPPEDKRALLEFLKTL